MILLRLVYLALTVEWYVMGVVYLLAFGFARAMEKWSEAHKRRVARWTIESTPS